VAKDLGIDVIERPVDKSELLIADEVFLSGTAAKVTPVRQVENYTLSTERPVTDQIRDKLAAITEGRDEQYKDWVFGIDLA
jgi:branched-chain amino acid aminotransferase